MRHSFLKTIFDPNNYQTYHAHCHCGAIRYTADVSPPLPPEGDHEVVSCNCPYLPYWSVCTKVLTKSGAMCIRTGAWNVYVPAETVRFTRGVEKLSQYRYLGITRNFCPTCGTHMTITPHEPTEDGQKIIALNVRAFADIDTDEIEVRWVEMRDAEPEYDVEKMPES